MHLMSPGMQPEVARMNRSPLPDNGRPDVLHAFGLYDGAGNDGSLAAAAACSLPQTSIQTCFMNFQESRLA